MQFILVYITTKDRQQAQSIGLELVKLRLVACVNIVDGMQSIYHWDGKICEDSETILVAKTRGTNFDAIVKKVMELHSYTCPCVIALPILHASEEYLKWLEQETNSC